MLTAREHGRRAALAMIDAMVNLAHAEQAQEFGTVEDARRLATDARTAERLAEYHAGAAMLGKDGAPKE